VAPTAAELLRRWDEPHRSYHNRTHLTATLDALRTLLSARPAEAPAIDAGAVALAVWFHDAVYAGHPGADEEASAALAERMLTGLGQPAARVAEVARLVRLTTHHDPADDDVTGRLLCDADLSILAAPRAQYGAYAAAVRLEYAHVPDAAFRAGRAAVLRGLLERGRFYRTTAGQRLWEERARANVGAELAALTSPVG
jgi:predicted metal-dependent HD superfamily phosphohydrolase